MTVKSTTTTGDFSVSGGCKGKLAANGGSCTLDLIFTPTATGTRTGTLTIVDTDPSSPQIINLTGHATNLSFSTAPVISGGKLSTGYPAPEPLGSTTTVKVTLTNKGNTPLIISNIAIGGEFASQYSETDNCVGTISAGGSCTYHRLQADYFRIYSGPANHHQQRPLSPEILYLQGQGTQIVVPAAVTFPNATVGSTTTQNVTVQNSGKTTLTFGGFSTSCWNATVGICSYSSQTNNCGASLAGGKSCTVTISFTPPITGSIREPSDVWTTQHQCSGGGSAGTGTAPAA